MKVLLLVDVQPDFCPGGGLPVPAGDEVVPVLNRLMREGGYDLIIATQDWHPVTHSSFAANNQDRREFETIQLSDGRRQTFWPMHCVQDTPGAALHPGLETEHIHYIIRKGTDVDVDSLSGFRDNARNSLTGLSAVIDQEAQRRGKPRREVQIDVTGLAGDICAKLTALDGAEFGYQMRFVIDATRSLDASPIGIANLVGELRAAHVEVLESHQILPRVRPLQISEASPELPQQPQLARNTDIQVSL